MPYFIWTPEFDQESRQYFQNKKEKKRGPFKELVHKRKQFEAGLHQSLNDLNNIFNKDITQENIDLTDILYASHLWAMYIVPEFQFPNQIHQWLQNISKVCHFNYHGPYWSE